MRQLFLLSPTAKPPGNWPLCGGEAESGFSGCPETEHLDLSKLLTLLPHPACCAHKGLELHNLFQNRGEKLSSRQGDHDLQWGWS